MRFVLGALAIGFGVYYLFTFRSAAAGGAEFHRKLHRVAPWLYRCLISIRSRCA